MIGRLVQYKHIRSNQHHLRQKQPRHLSPTDIIDLSVIYNPPHFQYCVPEKVVSDFYQGTAFGRIEPYTADEQQRLTQDIKQIYSNILARNPVKERLAVITAGAPGAGKTILMRQLLGNESASGRNFAYVDPDDVCLKEMSKTYGQEPSYDKWRPGSNAATHLILANLIRENYAFYFGSTSSSPLTASTFKYLKEFGYRIHLIHVIAPDDIRWESIKERDKSFVQITQQDIIEKGKLIPQRIHDTYLQYADQIDFYYRDKRDQDAVLTATWLGEDQNLTIYDSKIYEAMIQVHNAICNSKDLLWENSVGLYQ